MRGAIAWLGFVIACHHDGAPAPVPPAVSTCGQIASHMRALLEPNHKGHGDAVREAVERRCRDEAWSSEVRTCIAATKALDDGHHCLAKLPAEQRTGLIATLDLVVFEPTAPVVVVTGKLPPSCEKYRALMETYFDCPSIPQAARDAGKQALDQAMVGWENLPVEARATLDEGCKAALSSVTAMTCPP